MMDWKLEERAGSTWIGLSGEITENSDFAPLLEKTTDSVVLDLADIKRINSCGVREWINFVSALGKSGKRLVMERCSVPVVHQLNMITNFRGEADIRSIFAPYYCPACDREDSRFVDLGVGDSVSLEEAPPCGNCGEPMEFDDMPDAYLAFRTA